MRVADRGDAGCMGGPHQPVADHRPDRAAARAIERVAAHLGRLARHEQHHPRPVGQCALQSRFQNAVRLHQRIAMQIDRDVGAGHAAPQPPVPASVQRLARPGRARCHCPWRRRGGRGPRRPGWPGRPGDRRCGNGVRDRGGPLRRHGDERTHVGDHPPPQRPFLSAEPASRHRSRRSAAPRCRSAAAARPGRVRTCRPPPSAPPRPIPNRYRTGWRP